MKSSGSKGRKSDPKPGQPGNRSIFIQPQQVLRAEKRPDRLNWQRPVLERKPAGCTQGLDGRFAAPPPRIHGAMLPTAPPDRRPRSRRSAATRRWRCVPTSYRGAAARKRLAQSVVLFRSTRRTNFLKRRLKISTGYPITQLTTAN